MEQVILVLQVLEVKLDLQEVREAIAEELQVVEVIIEAIILL